jgi:acetyltransferase-like isoleucine patch superfamily enzyme
MIKKLKLAISSLWHAIVLMLPDEFSKIRVKHYNKKGCKINLKSTISPNVRIRGKFEMGKGSSIAHNCTISGEKEGVLIGENVMIAPNVVIVAFNHGHEDIDVPMSKQGNVEGLIIIEDDVWVAANCTIGKGVRIGKGAIISANSFVNRDVPAYSIVGGVPAKIIKSRICI